MKKLIRIATNRLHLTDGSIQNLSVIEIQSGQVTQWYALTQELPQTEWQPGDIWLRRESDGRLCAYHDKTGQAIT